MAKAGPGAIVWTGVAKTPPLLGFVLALFLVLIVSWVFVRATPFGVDSTFRSLEFVSAALYLLGHSGNDAQKTMGSLPRSP